MDLGQLTSFIRRESPKEGHEKTSVERRNAVFMASRTGNYCPPEEPLEEPPHHNLGSEFEDSGVEERHLVSGG